MKKILLIMALIAGFTATASAQGIEPVSTAPELDVTVGTQASVDPLLVALGAAGLIAVVIIASGDESDGTN